MNTAVIIPAKGQSDRLPGKNLQRVGDKTLLEWSIQHGKQLVGAAHVYVSSEDAYIQDAARFHDVGVIDRPAGLSEPEVVGIEVVHHAVDQLKGDYDWFMYLQPTNPYRDIDLLKAQLRVFFAEGVPCGFSGFAWNGHLYTKNALGVRGLNHRVGRRRGLTQEADVVWIEDGSFYIFNREVLNAQDYFWDPRSFIFPTHLVLDIDTMEDLEAARKVRLR